MNGLEIGMRLETRRGMQNRYARERANVEVTAAEFCECGLVKRGSYTDEKFTVRCADCLLPIRGAFDAWTMRFAPLTEVQLQNVMQFPHGGADCDRRCPAHTEGA